MTNWNEIYTDYLLGQKASDLAKKYEIDYEKISKKMKSEKWTVKRKKVLDSVLDNFEMRLEGLTKKAFEQLDDILNDEMASSTSKIQATKMIIDLAGIKKDKKEVQKEVNYEVFINRESVKCK